MVCVRTLPSAAIFMFSTIWVSSGPSVMSTMS